jgi:hypothetical protein
MAMCTICLLPPALRNKVDTALFAGVGYRKISARYSTKMRKFSHVAVCRHRKHLIPRDVRRQPPPPDPKVAGTLLERIEGMIEEFRSIANATRQQQPPWAIAAMKEIMRGLEMIGKMTGEIPSGGGINFNFVNGNLTEDQLGSFLDALKKRGPETVSLFSRLAEERLGLFSPPQLHVHFRSPEDRIAGIDADIFVELRSLCERDVEWRERIKEMIATIERGIYNAPLLPAVERDARLPAIGIGAVSPNGDEL